MKLSLGLKGRRFRSLTGLVRNTTSLMTLVSLKVAKIGSSAVVMRHEWLCFMLISYFECYQSKIGLSRTTRRWV